MRAVALAAIAFIFGSLFLAPGAAHAEAGTSVLNAGERLNPGQELKSPNGVLELVMQGDGNLVLYAPGMQARWYSATNGHPGAWAQMQGDGNFVVYGPDNVPLWHSFAQGGLPGANRVQLQNDGNLVEYTPSNAVTWNTGTFYFPSTVNAGGELLPGQSLQSPNGQYKLAMQGDGNLVLYGADGHWLWNTGTDGKPVTKLAVQGDGNLVLYTPTGYAWQAGTHGNTGGSFGVQNDGNVVYYTPSWTPIWDSTSATNLVRPPVDGHVVIVDPGPADIAIDYARAQIGKPYKWAGVGPDSFDCSGLAMMSWRAAGISLPRTAQQQYNALPKVPYSQIQKGDLIFFGNGPSGIFHVAIYSGDGQMVEAPAVGIPVREKAVRTSSRMGTVGRPNS